MSWWHRGSGELSLFLALLYLSGNLRKYIFLEVAKPTWGQMYFSTSQNVFFYILTMILSDTHFPECIFLHFWSRVTRPTEKQMYFSIFSMFTPLIGISQKYIFLYSYPVLQNSVGLCISTEKKCDTAPAGPFCSVILQKATESVILHFLHERTSNPPKSKM